MKTLFLVAAAYLAYRWYEENHCSCGGDCASCSDSAAAAPVASSIGSPVSDVAPTTIIAGVAGPSGQLKILPKPPAPKPAPAPSPVYTSTRLPLALRGASLAISAADKTNFVREALSL